MRPGVREQKVSRVNSDYEMSRAKSENELLPHLAFIFIPFYTHNHFQITFKNTHFVIEITFDPPCTVELQLRPRRLSRAAQRSPFRAGFQLFACCLFLTFCLRLFNYMFDSGGERWGGPRSPGNGQLCSTVSSHPPPLLT